LSNPIYQYKLGDGNMARLETNQPAPDFILQDFNGIDFRLSDYQNEKNVIVVLNRGFA
jgi:hypothetical protein